MSKEQTTECHCEEWCFCGIFCESHVSKVVKAVGKAMLMPVQPESVSPDERCMIVGCGNHVQFVAFRDADWEEKHNE